MKSGEVTLARNRFEVDEAARNVADLERTIRDLEGKAADLDRQLRAEEDHVRIKDPKHFAYSSFAHSARMRRDKLLSSVVDLKAKLGVAAALLGARATSFSNSTKSMNWSACRRSSSASRSSVANAAGSLLLQARSFLIHASRSLMLLVVRGGISEPAWKKARA